MKRSSLPPLTQTIRKLFGWDSQGWWGKNAPPCYNNHGRTRTPTSGWETPDTAGVPSDLHELIMKSKSGAALLHKTTTCCVELPHLQFGGSTAVDLILQPGSHLKSGERSLCSHTQPNKGAESYLQWNPHKPAAGPQMWELPFITVEPGWETFNSFPCRIHLLRLCTSSRTGQEADQWFDHSPFLPCCFSVLAERWMALPCPPVCGNFRSGKFPSVLIRATSSSAYRGKKNKNMQDNQDFSFRLHELKDRRKSRRQEDMLSVGINTVIRFLAERKMKILIPLCAMRMKLGPCDQ